MDLKCKYCFRLPMRFNEAPQPKNKKWNNKNRRRKTSHNTELNYMSVWDQHSSLPEQTNSGILNSHHVRFIIYTCNQP